MNSLRMIFKYWLKSRKFFIIEFIYLIVSTFFYMMIPVFIGRMVGALQFTTPSVKMFMFSFIMLLIVATFSRRC